MTRATKRHVICVDNKGYEASLERKKRYVALPDARAEKLGQIRVIDESGEDYLYAKSAFVEALTVDSSVMLNDLNWHEIRQHYEVRKEVHRDLAGLRRSGSKQKFVELLLGITDPAGNYSASEHNLGERILSQNLRPYDQIWKLAERLADIKSGLEVPRILEQAAIRYLAISVGSEACCMLSPDVCWVTNVRSVWSHIALQTQSIDDANDALTLYRQNDPASLMLYKNWMDPFHAELPSTLGQIKLEGAILAKAENVKPGSLKYLWTDAIVSAFYARYHSD